MTTATANQAEKDVLEYAAGDKPHRVDRERGIIHDVKIIGHTSVNGHRYTPAALSQAKELYEGASVNINHPSAVRPGEDRSFYDWFGQLRNVRESAEGLFSDLHYLKSHSESEKVCEAAERMPNKFGLSHNAVVLESVQDGQTVYHTINRVRSVDLVCKPGTTRGIFESERTTMDPTNSGAAAEPASGGSDMTWQMFIDKASEIYNGEGDGASKATQIGKLAKALFKVADQLEKALNGDAGKTEAPAAPAETSATESLKETPAALSELERLRRRDAARDVLESAGIGVDEHHASRINALSALATDDERKALVATWKPLAGVAPAVGAKPKSTPANVLESQQTKGEEQGQAKRYENPQLAAAALMGRG